MQRIERQAVLHSIDESSHWWEYAEMPQTMETWDEKIERRLRKDEEAKALFWLAISLAIIFAMCAWWPR